MNLRNMYPVRYLPDRLPLKAGKKLNVSTAWRWATRGCGGRRLRTLRIGRTLFTSDEWVREFFEAERAVKGSIDSDAALQAEHELQSIGM